MRYDRGKDGAVAEATLATRGKALFLQQRKMHMQV
jgi:hypothetical protein